MVCYYKVRQRFYYKVGQVLLPSAPVIKKCDNFITKCDRYTEQSTTVFYCATITNFDRQKLDK